MPDRRAPLSPKIVPATEAKIMDSQLRALSGGLRCRALVPTENAAEVDDRMLRLKAAFTANPAAHTFKGETNDA